MTKSIAIRLTLLLALAALLIALPVAGDFAKSNSASAAVGLDCNSASLKRTSESKGHVIHTCSGNGVVDYTVHCGPRGDQQFSVRYTGVGMSLYYPYDCGTLGYATSVSYRIR